MKIVFELPHCHRYCGGVKRTLKLAEQLSYYHKLDGEFRQLWVPLHEFPKGIDVHVRFQKMHDTMPSTSVATSVGMPNQDFPECDVAITYSDTPYPNEFAALQQVKAKYALMLSYGMAIERERRVVAHPKIQCLASTRRTHNKIQEDGGECEYVGFGLDDCQWTCNTAIERKPYLAMFYHPHPNKKYNMSVELGDKLCAEGMIQGCMSFGMEDGYANAKRPKRLVKHIINATPSQVRDLFSECAAFVMPSITEGLNRTPIESTLCGCPAILCDGAIGDIYHDALNCKVVNCDEKSLYSVTRLLLEDWQYYGQRFQQHMRMVTTEYTWRRAIQRLLQCVLP